MGIDGQRLKKLRESHGLSPQQMADKLNISRTAYLKYENGKTSIPRKLEHIAEIFDVSTDYLFERDNQGAYPPEIISIAKEILASEDKRAIMETLDLLPPETVAYIRLYVAFLLQQRQQPKGDQQKPPKLLDFQQKPAANGEKGETL